MKYLMLIYQGDAPTPRSPGAWASLSEDEQKAVYADYQAINETPGVSPGLQLGSPETATTVRVQDGKTLTTDGPFVEIKEAIGGYLVYEAEDRLPRRLRARRGSRAGGPFRLWMARVSDADPSRALADVVGGVVQDVDAVRHTRKRRSAGADAPSDARWILWRSPQRCVSTDRR